MQVGIDRVTAGDPNLIRNGATYGMPDKNTIVIWIGDASSGTPAIRFEIDCARCLFYPEA